MKYADEIFKEIEEREAVDTINYIVDDGWEDYIRRRESEDRGMTGEEAIKKLKWFREYNEDDFCGGDRIQDECGDWYYRITEQDFEAFDMAIKALEQEPILEQIRAEIERLQKMCDKNDLNLMAQYSAFGMVLDILDKYKAESEVQE